MDRVVDELARRGDVATFGELRLVASERQITLRLTIAADSTCVSLIADRLRISEPIAKTASATNNTRLRQLWYIRYA